ncbi:hypothetical protein ACIQ7D_22545 [Streptomyces sp. NPDC096310]|uniref:hypothetical protein n=1 Tax=Streptomyces sp. NPDC096310 TaxID=3366082 RepID=UPI003807618B
MTDVEHICRVCGYDYGGYSIREDGAGNHDICDCCGVTFGYEDNLLEGVRDFRAHWVGTDFAWADASIKPRGWDVNEQMRNIPSRWC